MYGLPILNVNMYRTPILPGIRVVVVLHKLREKVLEELHISQPGIQRMKLLARSHVWWPHIDQDIQEMVKGCCACQEVKQAPPVAPLHPWIWPSQPWKRIYVDFAGPFMGGSYLIVVDAHSKRPEVHHMSTTTTTKTLQVLRSLFTRYGIPEQLSVWQWTTICIWRVWDLYEAEWGQTYQVLSVSHPHPMVKKKDLFLLSSKQFKLARGKASL